MEVLEYELNRYDKLKSQIANAPRESKLSKVPTPSKLPVPRSAPITTKIVRSQIPVISSTNSDNRRHSASFEKQTMKGTFIYFQNIKNILLYRLLGLGTYSICIFFFGKFNK